MTNENGEGEVKGYWSGHKVLDPTELESRFSVEDGLAFLDVTGSEEISDESLEKLERVKKILDHLPPREADFVELYFFRHLKQTDIAAIFRVSQPTVCYRLQRAADRIRFLLDLPEFDDGELIEALEGFLSDPLDVEIMILMYETTCQSEVAKRLGVSQGLVRHRFIRSIERMDEVDGMDKYADMFRMISENLNILREVQRPSWGQQVMHAVE
jgi:DNA-directed RNA polymerase specialized sigma24 family protein